MGAYIEGSFTPRKINMMEGKSGMHRNTGVIRALRKETDRGNFRGEFNSTQAEMKRRWQQQTKPYEVR